MDKFLIRKSKVKIQTECTEVMPTIAPRFTRAHKLPVKKLPAAGIGPDTHSEYSATEN
jgi:hypothetical protein